MIEKTKAHLTQVSQILTAAQSALKSIQQQAASYAKSITDSLLSSAALTGASATGAGGTLTAKDILNNLAFQGSKVNRFGADIATLRRTGLRSDLIDQIISGGTDSGLTTADALIAGGTSAIRQANQLQSGIAQTSAAIGQRAAADMYGAAVAKAIQTVKLDTKVVSEVRVYLDGLELRKALAHAAQKHKGRNGTTALA